MALWLKIAAGVFGALCVAGTVFAAAHTEHPVRRLAVSGLQGVCALGAVDLLGTFTGVSLGWSFLSCGVSLVLGVPGVIGMLLEKCLLTAM